MKALIAAAALFLVAAAPIDTREISATVKVLASDAFEGRGPGTPGEQKTLDYLIGRFKALGLEPGGRDGSWTDPVRLVRTQIGAGTMRAGGMALRQNSEIYVNTVRPVSRVAIADAPLVFVGYGVTAPERGWDDFKGVDLKGKIAVMLVNDPDFEAQAGDDAKGRFGDRRMTYYGRWPYKYEEAARRGALGALLVHDTPGAGYAWSTVIAPGGEQYDIVRKDPNARVLLQGWIEGAAAQALFAKAGLDLAAERARARRADFAPAELKGVRFAADLAVTATTVESRNLIAKISGSKHPDEYVMLGAHWDAFGIGVPDAAGRTVRPGANDDALGVAGLIELARGFAKGPRPERTLLFAMWTAEERGLVGSLAYAADPLYPHAKTVANLTLDVMQTGGPARDVMLVGQGQTDLEDALARAAAAQGRTVTPEMLPERGLFYRADHFSVAREGVPTLLMMAMSGAPDLVTGGRAAGEAWLKGYMACYHQTCDAWKPDWDLRGVAADVELVRTIAGDLANSRQWPAWRAGSEFKAIRDRTSDARK